MKKYLAAAAAAIAVAGVGASSAQAYTPDCGNAANYTRFVMYNEALFIATANTGHTNTIENVLGFTCSAVAGSGRAYVDNIFYKATDQSNGVVHYIKMSGYVYGRTAFDSSCNPSSHDPDLGNVTEQYQSANRVPLSSGVLATPCK